MAPAIEKVLIGFRSLQLPLSFIFLFAICWVEAVTHIGAAHPVTSFLRFFVALLTLPHTAYDLFYHATKRDLARASRTHKLLRAAAETLLTALWFTSLILGAMMQNSTLGNADAGVNTVAVLASACWVLEIVLFSGSLVVVLVQTVRRWRPAEAKMFAEGAAEYEG